MYVCIYYCFLHKRHEWLRIQYGILNHNQPPIGAPPTEVYLRHNSVSNSIHPSIHHKHNNSPGYTHAKRQL